MVLLKLFLLSLVSFATTDLRVLFFTMDSCPPCKQTEPNVDRLRSDGVAVSKIDVRQYSDYADQCQVQQTPTIMVVQGDKVLTRHTGALTYTQLRQMLAQSNTLAESASQDASSNNHAVATQGTPASKAADRSANGRSNSGQLTPEQLAHRATVRFRVEDDSGVSFATGTIIHRQNDEALVLTCGHVFRDSDGQGKINTDLGFAFGEKTTVIGKLLYYDAEKHDIALVAIPCPFEIEPVKVGPESMTVQTGDRIFSIGCDKGADPSIRQSVLKARTIYSGVSKFDIVGRPTIGRSGGGLFSAGGQLIGVCNAAAIDVDEGIYAGLESIYWQFAKTNLTHLFRREAVPAELTFDSKTSLASKDQRRAPAATTGRLNHPNHRADQVVARGDELKPNVNAAVFRGNQVPVNTAIYRGSGAVPVRQASGNAGSSNRNSSDMEMIVILRSTNDPSQTETHTIANPDAQTLQWIRQSSSGNGEPQQSDPSPNRMARLPEVPRPRDSNPQIRGQSPR